MLEFWRRAATEGRPYSCLCNDQKLESHLDRVSTGSGSDLLKAIALSHSAGRISDYLLE